MLLLTRQSIQNGVIDKMEDKYLLDEIFDVVCSLFNLNDELIEKKLPEMEYSDDDRANFKNCISTLNGLLLKYGKQGESNV